MFGKQTSRRGFGVQWGAGLMVAGLLLALGANAATQISSAHPFAPQVVAAKGDSGLDRYTCLSLKRQGEVLPAYCQAF